MAKKKGKGFFSAIGKALGSIPVVAKVKKAAKTVKIKIKTAKKKLKNTVKKVLKKVKKKIGKVYTKARKIKNNLSKSKIVKKVKKAVKKAVLVTKKAVKKVKNTVKAAGKTVKKATKTAVIKVKKAAKKVVKHNKQVAALVIKSSNKPTEKASPQPTKTYSVHDGEPITTLTDKRNVLSKPSTATPDGLAPYAMIGYTMFVEDWVTLMNPNATPEEQFEAKLSLLNPFKKVEKAKDTMKAIEGIDSVANLVQDGKKVNNALTMTSKEKDQLKEYIKKLDKGSDKGKGVSETNLRNIDDFINGNKKFDEVIEDYAKVYKENVDLNKPWSWDDTIPGGDSLSSAQKRKIKEMAIEKGHIPEIKVTKADGMRYGFADFASAGVVEETVQLPDKFWKLSDKEQFKWLDEQIGGTRKGMTWHHAEVPGKMELVPFGIHNITPHNGGRSKGMWADAPR